MKPAARFYTRNFGWSFRWAERFAARHDLRSFRKPANDDWSPWSAA